MNVQEELSALAEANRGHDLIIMGHKVDKSDPTEVYGALCWIESQLLGMLQMRSRPE